MARIWLNNLQTIEGNGTIIDMGSAVRSINGFQLKDENSAITEGFPDPADIQIIVPATKSIVLKTDGGTPFEITDAGGS